MERCPCCKARLGGATLCPRCQADLSKVIGAEQSAQYWLSKAIQHWEENEDEQSLSALELSLRLKITKLALVFRDFLIHQQCRGILDLLAQKKLLPAQQRLYRVRKLLPYSKLLQQLHSFTDYLLAKNQEHSKSLPD
jgi:methylphosphotriester-DNA--protein-cysteine methyltransferase